VADRSEQDQRVVRRGDEAAPLPECCGFSVDGIDHQRATADEGCHLHAAFERMLDQAGADPSAGPDDVGGELGEKQARHRVWWLAGADRPGQDTRDDRCWRQTIIADHTVAFMDDHDGGEALLLVGERPVLEPMVEGWLSAGEFGKVVGFGERFGRR